MAAWMRQPAPRPVVHPGQVKPVSRSSWKDSGDKYLGLILPIFLTSVTALAGKPNWRQRARTPPGHRSKLISGLGRKEKKSSTEGEGVFNKRGLFHTLPKWDCIKNSAKFLLSTVDNAYLLQVKLGRERKALYVTLRERRSEAGG